ncbi:MAG: hypothetical protein ACRCXT_15470 [Paraclostridium sp.]
MKMTLEQLDITMIEKGYSPIFLGCGQDEINNILEKNSIEYISFDESEYKKVTFTIYKKDGINSLVKINN